MTGDRSLRSDVLARLLLVQSTAGLLRDAASILGFVRRGLEQVPGVGRASYEPEGEPSAHEPGTRRFPLRSGGQSQGALVLRLTDPLQFEPYAPYVSNVAALIALVLDERRARLLIESHQRELEARVEERTRQLSEQVRERQAAERAYRAQAAELREAQRLAGVGSWEWTVGGDAIEWSEGLFLILRRDARRGAPTFAELRQLYTPESWARLEAAIAAALETGAPYELELEMLRDDGTTCWTTTRGEAVRAADGSVVALRGTAQDVSARKRVETERERLEAQLRASQKMEAVGSLAGGVAHDFNNMLAVILSYTEFATDGVGAEHPVRADLDEIRNAAQRAAALTRQLLAFSRRQRLEPKVLDLNRVVEGLRTMLRRMIGEDIDLVLVLGATPRLVRADPGQLEQVIMNLVVNARDAMPAGGTLTIETAERELDAAYAADHVGVTPGPYVLLAIHDTGHGMDGATLQRIFEPFFTTKEMGKGTGLGLSTAFGIVAQSGGHIAVRSELGKGARFEVYLPRALSEPAVSSKAPVPARGETGTETILVAEDEDAVRSSTSRILRAAGFEVLVAGSGEEAIRVAEAHAGEIHLLLTDVVMPGMKGPELAQRLRKLRPELRLLCMSGYTDTAIAGHGVLGPGTAFIGKPFGGDELVRKVRDVLHGGSRR